MAPEPPEGAPLKELKVKLDTRLHLQLQARKIMHGKTIGATVTEALDAYFLKHPTPGLAPTAGPERASAASHDAPA